MCIDAFQDGGSASFQSGFGDGEGAAVKLSAPGDGYPFTILSLQFLFGDDGTTAGEGFTVSARVYDDDGDSLLADPGFPGTQLGEETGASILSSPDSVSEVAFQTPVSVAEGDVWVALFVTHDGAPGIARDAGGIVAGKNALYSGGGWLDSSDYGLTGDWILRAVVDTPSTATNPACTFVIDGEGEGEGDGEGEGEADGEGEGEVDEALFITSVNPAVGSAGTETRVTITGGGFVDGIAFRVGATDATDIAVENEGAALATVPAGLAPGTYDVIAQVGSATFVYPSGFAVMSTSCGSCAGARGAWPPIIVLATLMVVRRRSLRGRGHE